MATTIKNSGGNRALVAYLHAPELFDEEINGGEIAAFDSVINDVLKDVEYSDGGTIEREIDTPRTVAINLSSGAWARSLKIGNCSGDLIVGVFFYDQPAPPEPEIVFVPTDELGNPIGEPEYSEPEPAPSLTSLVCDAMREALGGVYGASSFVVPATITEFTLEVE